jgi:ferredoxin
MAYLINKKCTKCAACLFECPTGSITEGKEQYFIDADTCENHAACVSVCPVDAIVPMPSSPAAGAKAPASADEEA